MEVSLFSIQENSMRKLGLIFLVSALAASAADVYTFGLLPPSGSVQGAPGSTVGWGYALQNQSSALWLVPINLNAGAFANGTPALLFDFPVLAPATSVAESFDPAQPSGLYELTWDSSAPAGFTNTGTFTLDAEWWSGDPLAGGVLVSGAPSASASYRASVAAPAVPEPGTFELTTMTLIGLLLVVAGFRRSRSRAIS
jgi:hypothetical protein